MRRVSLIVAVIGIFIIVGIMVFSENYTIIQDQEDLESLIINEKVVVNGRVDSERILEDFRILRIKDIEVVCDCSRGFFGENVKIYGVVGEFDAKKQVEALRVVSFIVEEQIILEKEIYP